MGPQTPPHCVQQVEFCVSWSNSAFALIEDENLRKFDDPRDLIADIFNSGRVFMDAVPALTAAGARAYDAAASVISWSKTHSNYRKNALLTIRDDCIISGTINFLDNDEPN